MSTERPTEVNGGDHGRAAVAVEGLTKRYGDVLAVDDLSLTVDSGELFGFLGPNGAGKTTTIGMLTGQRTPTDGSVRVLDHDPVADPVGTRAAVGILPERGEPPSFLTPREYFDFVAAVRGFEDVALDDRIGRWTDRLSFGEKLDTLCTDLSRGQRQKVLVTAAFLHEPELVFIDEPLANLDPIVQERLKSFLVDYVDDGNTVFLSTHYIDVAEAICSRVGVLRAGRLVGDVRPADHDGELLEFFE